MRLVPVLALMTSAFALAACAGGGGGLNGGGTLSAAGIVASNGTSVCGINETGCIPTPPVGGGGGGTPSPSTGVGSAAGGNVETNVPGNRTIALEQFVLDKPTDPKIPAISQITSTLTPTFADTDAAVMSGTKPASLRFTINTKSPNNSKWAVPAEMPEWVNGTRDLRWIELRHTTVDFNNPAAYVINDTMGNPIRYNFLKNAFEYTVAHIGTDGKFHNRDALVDHSHDDYYWNQIAPYMGSKANAGSKKDYREYWLQDTDVSVNRDEMMQVWDWKESYSVHYQNQIGGGSPKQQAWSFGGKAATDMTASGKARYTGRYAATAKPNGWLKNEGSTVDPNAIWMVQGRSDMLADFDKSTIRGTLSPESWTSDQEKKWYTWYTNEATTSAPGEMTHAASTDNINYYKFFDTDINVGANIVAGDTTKTTNVGGVITTTPVKNAISGIAALGGDFKTGNNALYGGFFGTNGSEVTGIFSTDGTVKQLVGGSTGNADPKEATINISGTFNGQCTASPGFTCPP